MASPDAGAVPAAAAAIEPLGTPAESRANARSTLLVTGGVNSLLSQLKQTQTYDYLRAAANTDLTKFLLSCGRKASLSPPVPELIQFADTVIKINRKQKRQERVLVVTDVAVYNFAPGSFKTAKRRILVRDLRGVILSRCSDEMVLQVVENYDYRWEIKRRSEVLEMLSRAYEKVTSEVSPTGEPLALMVTFSEEQELKDMVVTKDVLRDMHLLALRRNTHVNGMEHVLVPIDDEPAAYSSSDTESTAATPSYMALASSPSLNSIASGSIAMSHTPASQQQPSSPTSAPLASGSPSIGPGSALGLPPRAKLAAGGKGIVRQSLITHGAALLNPHLLAKIANQSGSQSAAFAMAKQSHALSSGQVTSPVAAQRTLLSGAYPQYSPSKPLVSGNYHSTRHGLLEGMGSAGGNLLSGAYQAAERQNRSASKAIGVNDVDSQGLHAFRDPNSRLEGWLTKQKGSSKRWDRKYFSLSQRELQYYAPRIKGSVKLKATVTSTRFNSDVSLKSKKPSSSSSVAPAAATDAPPLIMLRVESGTHLKGKDALVLAFACEEDATVWSEAFLDRNNDFAPHELDQYIHLEGWLMRKEKEKWNRRYVVLTQDHCWFFDMSLKGSVEFTKGVSAHSSNQIQPTEEPQARNFAGRRALTRFAYRWNVSDSVRIFHLAADSEEDLNLWIEAIENVNREHGKAGAAEEVPLPITGGIKLPDEFIEAVEQPAPEGLVTFVFTDVQNSTSLWEKVPTEMDVALEQHDRLLRELLKKYAGYEVKTEGDAFMVTFFNALDAVLWCLAVQVALVEAEWSDEFCAMPSARKEVLTVDGEPVTVFNGIRIRMGVHTGSPNARRNPVTGRMDYFGQCLLHSTLLPTPDGRVVPASSIKEGDALLGEGGRVVHVASVDHELPAEPVYEIATKTGSFFVTAQHRLTMNWRRDPTVTIQQATAEGTSSTHSVAVQWWEVDTAGVPVSCEQVYPCTRDSASACGQEALLKLRETNDTMLVAGQLIEVTTAQLIAIWDEQMSYPGREATMQAVLVPLPGNAAPHSPATNSNLSHILSKPSPMAGGAQSIVNIEIKGDTEDERRYVVLTHASAQCGVLTHNSVNRSARVSDTGHGGQIVCTTEVLEQLALASESDPRFPADLQPLVEDKGLHSLKGINEPVRIFQLMPHKLRHRVLPPIRTSTNEKLEKERLQAAAAANGVSSSSSSSPPLISSVAPVAAIAPVIPVASPVIIVPAVAPIAAASAVKDNPGHATAGSTDNWMDNPLAAVAAAAAAAASSSS